MVFRHLSRRFGIYFFRCRVTLHIGLTAVRHIECLRRDILSDGRVVTQVIAGVRTIVSPVVQERIVMASHTGFNRTGKTFLGCQRCLIVQILRLNHWIAEEHKTVLRYILKQVLHHFPSFGVHMLTLIAVVGGVIPLSPYADKPCLYHIDHIRIRCQVRFELLQVPLHPVGCRIHLVILALRVRKTQHALKTMGT